MRSGARVCKSCTRKGFLIMYLSYFAFSFVFSHFSFFSFPTCPIFYLIHFHYTRTQIDLVKSFPTSTSSTQRKVTSALFLSRDGELRDIRQEFSDYVRYVLTYATFTCPKFPFFSLFPCPSFLNLLFEADSYSNEYLLTKFGFDSAENEP